MISSQPSAFSDQLKTGTRVRVSGLGEALVGDVVAVCTPDDLSPETAALVRAAGCTRGASVLFVIYGEPLLMSLYEINGEWSDGCLEPVEVEIVGQHAVN